MNLYKKRASVWFLRTVSLIALLSIMAAGCAHLSYTALLRQRASDALKDAAKKGADSYNKSEYEYAGKLFDRGVQKQQIDEVDEANTLFRLSAQLADEIAKMAQQNRVVISSEKKLVFHLAQEIGKDQKTVVLKAKPIPALPGVKPVEKQPAAVAVEKAVAPPKAVVAPVPIPAPPVVKPVEKQPAVVAVEKAVVPPKAVVAPVPIPAPPVVKPVEKQPAVVAVEKAPVRRRHKSGYYVVARGDCLWQIAKKRRIYDDPRRWPSIYSANKKKIKVPDLIYPGQVLRIPQGAVSEKELTKRLLDMLQHCNKKELMDILRYIKKKKSCR